MTLFQCTDGDVTCGKFFLCVDQLKRNKLPCGSNSVDCLNNAPKYDEQEDAE